MTIQQNETTEAVTLDNAVIGETLYFRAGESRSGQSFVVTKINDSLYNTIRGRVGDSRYEDSFYVTRFERRLPAPGFDPNVTLVNAVVGETLFVGPDQTWLDAEGTEVEVVGVDCLWVYAKRKSDGFEYGGCYASRFERREPVKPVEVTMENVEVGEILTLRDYYCPGLNAGEKARVTAKNAGHTGRLIMVEWLTAKTWGVGYYPDRFDRLPLELPDLDAELGTEIFALDVDALRALPAGTIIEDRDGDQYIRTEADADYEWADYDEEDGDYDVDGEESSSWIDVYQPVKIVNPEILGEFVDYVAPKFKAGDRVRVTVTRYGGETRQAGAIGTVNEDNHYAKFDYTVSIDGDGPWPFHERELELYVEPKFKVGDRVTLVGSPYTGHPTRKKGGNGTIAEVILSADGVLRQYRVSVHDGYMNETWGFGESDLALYVEPEPQPEPFEPLAYPTIATMEEADALPKQTVLVSQDYQESVYVKLNDGVFYRINRYDQRCEGSHFLSNLFDLGVHMAVVFAPGVTN